ncbi:hypothetical protein ARHIZOSPH14_33250 [Agromyces rhizosphaerae]|uniref:Cell division protein FtsL n=1 Tax=Agromyces rhizosphaerae TaxID=88374 RepID=A0A9W6CV90_9MICO|nr:hypothetical protein [Agromyces rhizosphaerae]GLI29083.1 hypothetical protein ARHIZOSPH14_33250 [Agromyces rhizosphaerae]
MSAQVLGRARPAERPAPRPHPRLRPAPEPAPRRARPRLAYAIVAVAGAALIIAAQLLLSVAVTQGAYEIDALQAEQTELARTHQQVAEELDRVESPQFLAANAESLGMVQDADPVYLRLSDGKVLGEPVPAAASTAGSSASLVPNSLISGVPLVTEERTASADAPSGAAPAPVTDREASGAAAAAEAEPDVPSFEDGLPTPSTR